jgi:hypothetical protein
MQNRVMSMLWILALCVLLGTASKRSEAVVHYGCFLNGAWVEGTTQNVYAGQQLNFSEHYQQHTIPAVPGSPTSTTVTVEWEIDGHPIKSYVIGPDSAEVTLLSPADLSQLNFTCYLLASGPATAMCRITEEAYTGQKWYATGSCGLTILKPALTPIPVLGHFIYTNSGSNGVLTFGNNSATPGGDGMYISNNGTDPAQLTTSSYCWCQLLHTFDLLAYNIPYTHVTVDPTLDGAFPYGNPQVAEFQDNPSEGAPIFFGVDPELLVHINATAYLMWNCGKPGSILVPINSTDWNAGAEEVGGVISGPDPVAGNIKTDITTPPTWENTWVK